ncbi:hypothetical protein [Dinoroseobacter shibae]|uniref:hypothetical protein n=1 Tax=Dinoroseobacter shibae TaxID=215813 RepID=UPI0002EA1640|nr:hypothetical protein [Dinoroseobacter shibae]URF47615.1 hypothetical protein M8008_04830 [Dinoroseobacter shibae]URF51925.1 hypothetical protein M8007_04830 [Dinoroseobacter shibae]
MDVTVPPAHVLGALERPLTLAPDPRTEFALVNPTLYGTVHAFADEIDRHLAQRPRYSREMLVFVHG